jgi:hypothetical protein
MPFLRPNSRDPNGSPELVALGSQYRNLSYSDSQSRDGDATNGMSVIEPETPRPARILQPADNRFAAG